VRARDRDRAAVLGWHSWWHAIAAIGVAMLVKTV
jgi:hypothetical protein